MSFDQLHDGEDNDPAPDRAPRPVPGLDHRQHLPGTPGRDALETSARDVRAGQEHDAREGNGRGRRTEPGTDTRSRSELAEENVGLGRALGELAAENADLYKRLDALQEELKASQAETRTEREKFRVWAKEISNREAERALQDEARDKREETFADRLAELEHRDAARPETIDSAGDERVLGRRKIAPPENDQQKRRPGRPSDAMIAVGAAYVAIGLSIYSSIKGSPEAATLATYGAEGTALFAAHVALFREHRKGKGRNGDRPEG